MKLRTSIILLFVIFTGGCVTGFVAVVPGTITVKDLNLKPTATWNVAPPTILPSVTQVRL